MRRTPAQDGAPAGRGSRWGAPMKKLSHAATVALELANRYRLAAITYRAIGALVLASACETMAETEMRVATAEIERPADDGGEG